MTLYDELIARGLIAQVTNEEEIKNMINNGKATFYIGFDCTADSLHVGHFMALCLMKRLQMAGNKPIALIGDGTTLIGDPSGRTDMRQMLTEETIKHNAECFKRQMERFIDFSDGKALMLYNSEWLKPLNYIELLREVGACFSVNNMLRAECYKQRMEKGLSFLEFNYMIMQSYDFYYMFQHYGCNMQFGGNDQWSNMLGGTELIRRKLGKDAHAMTITLLTDSQGKKMGKTAGNAVWLDPNKTSPFDFYQYWRNVDDADVMKLRVYTSPDPVGAELGAALKNVIALCAGITDGLGFGDNAKAMLMTRGLTETARLGVALGAKKETFAGLAGVGDLIVTCTSMHSRNRRAGILIGQGKDPQTAMKEVGAVVEGYYAAKSAYELGKAKGIDMPITDAAYKVLYEGADVKDAVQALLSRQRKSESEDAGWQ